MFFRKVIVSDECMKWLKKSYSSNVRPEPVAKRTYERRCNQVQEDVLQAITTVSKEPASTDGKTEIVVEVSLLKSEKRNVMMVVTKVYAVVYTKSNKKYYVIMDENGRTKRVSKMSNDIAINIKRGDHVETLRIVESKKYRISM